MKILLLIAVVIMPAWTASGQSTQAGFERVVEEIRTEAARAGNDSGGYPLPLGANWNWGEDRAAYTPDFQIQLLEQGHHILPWFGMPLPGEAVTPKRMAYYERAMRRCAELKLPICFVYKQWEY